MLELHRYRHVDWKPSPVVALAASIDGAVVAAARGNGSIEIWIVSPGSVGWHCELTVPGKPGASTSCLLWCPSGLSKRGRLFSAGLDGFISEWDLSMLQTKDILKSYGGSVWDMALEPLGSPLEDEKTKVTGLQNSRQNLSESDSDDDEIFVESGGRDLQRERVVVGCDDGCVRLFTVRDGESMVYAHTFPRVQGRILSVAWSADAKRIFSGGSDGCIRCWDANQFREVYRMTAGQGGIGSGSTLCLWSLLTLRDGTVVSGDSSGSTQFWDGKQGTLLQTYTAHKADVLALAVAPSHRSVFAAGADGQVVQYQLASESKILAATSVKSKLDIGVSLGDKWLFLGSKRTHSHDVNALVVASPSLQDKTGDLSDKTPKKGRSKCKKSWTEHKQFKLEQSEVPMLVSGGNDAKLFTYPANAFLAFHPHDVCFAPQCTPIQLAFQSFLQDGLILMAQHEAKVELWKININQSNSHKSPFNVEMGDSKEHRPLLGKRKTQESARQDVKRFCIGQAKVDSGVKGSGLANGHSEVESPLAKRIKHQGTMKGSPPELLARIKCKSTEHITCSALSDNGHLVAFSDCLKPRLFQLERQSSTDANEMNSWEIRKKRLPKNLPPAHSMVFCGCSHLILASSKHNILVVDIEACDTISQLEIIDDNSEECSRCPITMMCTSRDGQWLAASNNEGQITIFNLEAFRQHWRVPPLDGGPIAAALFHPGNSDVLIVATSGNTLHVLDVEARQFGDWSKQNGSRLPRSFLEFPGGIQGLSMSPAQKSTSVIAYGSKAMCLIDFKKPVPQDDTGAPSHDARAYKKCDSNGSLPSKEQHKLQNGTGTAHKNFVLVPFKDPVLFLAHASDSAIVLIEKPWLDALRQLPPPVYRHVYGT